MLEEHIKNCRHCPRMRAYQQKNSNLYPDYWNGPVPGMGPHSPLVILGLAPGLHGANKTGRPFTGDASGTLLFQVLDQLGIRDHVRITNAVKCAPPQNKPLGSERKNCQKFLKQEVVDWIDQDRCVVLCLGRVAHEALLRALDLPAGSFRFSHGAHHKVDERIQIVDSFHCSRYNIQTKRLTEPMFRSAVQCAAQLAQINHASI